MDNFVNVSLELLSMPTSANGMAGNGMSGNGFDLDKTFAEFDNILKDFS